VTIGTIAETARELLEENDDLLVVRVHAYRPFPGAALVGTLSHAAHVTVVDRAAAFGSFGPLAADVRALGIDAVAVVGGLGGVDVTPVTLRWALEQPADRTEVAYVPEGLR
jgi:pyruvate/2-oxoacid:ferredoxin oxidoreductase alpha subunit